MDKKLLFGFLEKGFPFEMDYNGGRLIYDLSKLEYRKNGSSSSCDVNRTDCFETFSNNIDFVIAAIKVK